MIKKLISVFTVFALLICTFNYSVVAVTADFTLDISADSQATFGETLNATITLNGLSNNTAVIGFDVYELSFDASVLKIKPAEISVTVSDWQVDVSDLSEKYSRGYAKIMATASATDVTSAQITQNGIFKITLPFEVIGVPTSGITQIKINSDITGVDSSYDELFGDSDVQTASINIEKCENSATPSAPKIEIKDSSSVTLKAVSGCEYSIDGKTWQNSNVFTGLTQDTQYTFRQRIAQTETHLASPASGTVSTYTLLDMTDYTYNVLGAQIRKNGNNYDLRFISSIQRDFVANKLPQSTEFGVLMARKDQCGDDELTVELVETADYTVKTVPIKYISTVHATQSTYTFTVTILSISDLDRTYVVRPYFILHNNVYYADELWRCVNDGLR